jgi:erythromycin esterase-like protein
MTTSWVIVRKSDGAAIHETWSRKLADRVNRQTHDVVPIAEWLAHVNAKAKASRVSLYGLDIQIGT